MDEWKDVLVHSDQKPVDQARDSSYVQRMSYHERSHDFEADCSTLGYRIPSACNT